MDELELAPKLARADWEEVLRRLTADMDPWAVDLVELVQRFRAFLAAWGALELEVPGRMVLAGSVLLRMKSEWLRQGKAAPSLEEVVEEGWVSLSEVESQDAPTVTPGFRLPLIRRPRARTTVSELRRALRVVLARGGRRPSHTPFDPEDLGLELDQEPFAHRAAWLLRHLLSLMNGERIIPFRRLLQRADPAEQVARFIELLHLDAEGEVRMFQEDFLGEILIEVQDGAKSAG
jgi:segregation and condensation protein A